ncbi:DNA polymerase zeta catalytic subunit like protein [Argiope bruennichi]|uniref:DNA polymerase zeta catalytic subunit n=1 Tax=Argiope bruennichi TaxID=94029 RepID=A0A8T0FW99_ARGBR|nr:DNA polymerase zeta catalytic subunit like protein [Argiope bruennichi]
MAMFSLRILTVDSYQCSPISGYDDCYSDFRGCEIYNVPVLTLFGTTQAGQKGAIHVHGVFPYLYLRWNDVFPDISPDNCRKYLQELALEIDKALNVEAAKSNCNKHHVHNITIEKKRSVYGFHAETEDFLKILFYYPWDTSSKIWNIAALSSSQVNNLPKKVYSELEVDCCEDAIVNKYDLTFHIGKNPGLVEIREDLKHQRKLVNQTSQLTPIPTQERDIEATESELFYKRILREIIQRNKTAAESLLEENNKSDVNGSQTSLIHSSSESFGLSNTQDREVLKLLVNMCENHVPEDDSILATKNDSESDNDDEVTNEMSQQFVDDILNAQVSSQHIGLQNPMHASNVFLNSINADLPSRCQEESHMCQVDGAYDGDNDTFEGPQLSKEEETNVNSELKEPPMLDPIHPPESLQQSWMIPCSVKMTDIGTVNSTEKMSLAFLANGSNARPKSKTLHAPLVKRVSCSRMNKNERLQKKKMTICPSVRILLKDLISKVVEQKNESMNGGSKTKCNHLQLNKDKTTEPKANADCFLGTRPKTRNNICPPLEKSCVIKKLPIDEVSATNSGSLPSKSTSWNDLLKPLQFINSTCIPSSSKHSKDVRPKMKNGKFKAHYESHTNKIYSDKDKNYELHLNSSSKKSPKKSELLKKLSARVDSKYKKKDMNDKQNVGLSDSDSTKLKKSSHDHNKFHSSPNESPCTKSPNSIQTFGTLESTLILSCNVLDYDDVKNVNFSKLGREVVVLKKLTEKEISDLKSGCSEINQDLISTQASTESKKDQKEIKNERKCYKIFDKNKLKPCYLNHIDSLDLKKSSEINTVNKELPFSEIQNSHDTDSDHSGLIGVSANESLLDNADSKKFKNIPCTLNNITPAFRLTGIIDEKLFALDKNSESSSSNNGMFVSQNDDQCFRPKALSGHQSTTSVNNVKESDDAIDCKNMLDPDVCILETATNYLQSTGNSSSMAGVSASNLKPEFQKSLKDSNHKVNSGKHRKKNKKGKQKGKADEELDTKYELHEFSKYNDFIKDSEPAFQNSLDERNVDYFPGAKAASPNVNLLINSATKMLGSDQNLNNKVIKPRAISSLLEASVPSGMDKINKKFSNIIKNSPYVKLVDCKKFIEENHPENLHLLSKKNRLFKNNEQRICNSSKVSSESKTKKFQIPRKEDCVSSSGCPNKNEFKHKFKNIQCSHSSSSKKRNQGYSKLDILSLPVKSKSSSAIELHTSNAVPSRSVNPKITCKSDTRNNLHINYPSSELTPSKIKDEINKNALKYTDSTFLNCIPNHYSKPSSSKNSNNHKLPDPDCIIVGEVKIKEASENKMSSKPKNKEKNKIPSQWVVKEDNDFKNSLGDNSIENYCNPKSKVAVTNENNDLVLIKVPEVKHTNKTHCEPKLNLSNSLDNSIITTNDLYDTVKRRTASKNQLAPKIFLKPDSRKRLNNNKSGKVVPTNSKTKTSKKNLADDQKNFLSVPTAKSDIRCPSSYEKEDSFPASERKNSVCVSNEKELNDLKNTVSVSKKKALFSSLNKNQSHMKKESVSILDGMTADSSALIGPPQMSEDITAPNNESMPQSPGPSTSTDVLHTDILSTNNVLNPIPEDSNGNESAFLLQTTQACGSLPTTSSKSILSRPSKGRASKMSRISNNFGFFSSKTPQRNRRCQNDPESLQFPKPMSSRLSLKSNKKNDFPNERKNYTSQQDSRAKWKIDNTLLDNNSQGCNKSTSSEKNLYLQSSETNILPQNVSIKSEPADDYDDNKNPVISDALKCFDFDEGSSSDSASFTFSHSKRTQNQKDKKNQQKTQQPKHGRNASKSNVQCSSSSTNESSKGNVHLNSPSTSSCNSSVNIDRYPKRNCSITSSVDDDVVILDETPVINCGSSRGTRKSSRLLSNNNTGPKEIIDLEKEDVCMNAAPVITIKRDSEGNNSIVPNKRCNISTNNVSRPECLACTQPSTSSSSCFCETDSSDILGSRNSADDSLSSPDSKHGLKLKLKLKTIMTRNNEPKIVVVGKHLDGEKSQENDMQNHCEVTIKVEGESEIKSRTKRTLGARSSKRRSKTNTDAPPLLIKDIKKEKDDDYEKSYVQPLKFSLASINAAKTEKPSTSLEPKCEPLKLYRRLNHFYLESDTSNKRKLPNSTDENPSKETEVLPKRRRGRPAKIQKSAPPQNDLSPLKNNTSFNKSSSNGSSTCQNKGTSSPDQLLDIGRRCSFPISDNIEECCYEKVGPDKKFDWLKVKIKQEPISDHEDAGKKDNNANVSLSSLENNASAATSRRRNSLRCESFKKFFDSGSDDDTKPKSVTKPQKKKTRSKSVNIETSKKNVEQPNEMPTFSNRRTRTRSGSFKKFFNGDNDGNSDSDRKYVSSNIIVKTKKETPPRRKRGRPPLLRNRQLSTDAQPSCNPCSVTLERLPPSLLKQGNSTKKTHKRSNFEARNEPNLNSAVGSSQQIPGLNSNSIPSYSIQNNESTMYIRPPCIDNDITHIEPHVLNSEKSDFEVLHSKVMGEKISPVLRPSTDKNPDTQFVTNSGPVTINGLNSIDINSNISELLSKKEIPDNQMNCPSFMYNSILNPDSSILSNQNSANFLRPPSHEMDQRVFESPSDILRSGNMDCQSPLLYSHSPIADIKHTNDNKFLHLNQSPPQGYKRQQDLIHSPVMNTDPMFDHCNSPLKEVITANENLKTQEKDFSGTMQRRSVNSYYSNCSDSYNEGSVIHKSKTKHDMFANDIPGSLHANDFSKEQQQHNSPYPFESNSLDQNEELSCCTTKRFDTYDKISKSQRNSLKYLGKTFSGRETNVTSCFPNNYSESRKSFHSIPKQTRLTYEGSNQGSSPYSRFPSSYGSPAGVQQQQPYSAANENTFNNSFHQRTDESLNSFQNHNEYYDRMKWENLNISSFSNTNDSYSENSRSPFSVHQNRFDSYYTKNNSDLNGSSRMNIDSYCKQKWSEVNTPYFPLGDRPLNEFPRNDRSLDEFSLNDRPVNDIFRYQPPQVQPESSKYDSSYPNINSQVSTSSETFDRTKSVNTNFSRFSTFDCNPDESKEFQNTAGKKYENAFDKNIEEFFNQHRFTSNSSEIQSPSPVSHTSSQLGTNSSPFKIDSTVDFNKKVDFNTESNDAGCSFIEVCKPSPCSSLSDQLDSVQSPSLINNSPLCMPNHPASVIGKFKMQEIIEELSSPCVEDVTNSSEVYDQKTLSPNNSRVVPVVSSDSGDTMSECSTILKSPDSLSRNAKITFNEQNVRTFEMNLDSVQEDSFDLLSDQMISEDESFLMDDNIFPNSPETKVDESSLIPVDNKDSDDVCTIPKTTCTDNFSAQSAEADQTSLNYIDCNVQILNFQECLTESDPVMHPFLGDLNLDFLSQDSNNITNKENDSNNCVKAIDVSVKDDLSDSTQTADKAQNNSGCPLFLETVPNVNVIVANPSSSTSDPPNSLVPLESHKNSIMPTVTVSNSLLNETPLSQSSPAFNPIGPTFLSTLMVNDSIVLPQSNFFFNNGSIIIRDDSSVKQDHINMFQNSGTDKNYSMDSESEVDSKDSQEVQNLRKSFNGEDDILSMIVKSCDIGEEFDEKFDSPDESLNNVGESNSILSTTENFDAASNFSAVVNTDSIPNSLPINNMKQITMASQDLPSNHVQKVESAVLSCELPKQINEYRSKENASETTSSVSSPNQSLEPSRDKESIQESAILDSMIHSFYGEETIYSLNALENCDSLSFCSNVHIYNASLDELNKGNLKSVAGDFPARYSKGIVIISPNQSSDLPCKGNYTLMAKAGNGSSWKNQLNLNDKLEFKKPTDSISGETNEIDLQKMLMKPGGSPPHYVRIVIWIGKPPEATTCSSLEDTPSQTLESTEEKSQPSENQSAQNVPNVVNQQLMITPTSGTDHGVLRQLLSRGVSLESTPNNRSYSKEHILDRLLLSPISKDNLLTNDIKKKRKLSFDDASEQSELPESKKLKGVHERSWKKSLISDQSEDISGNLTSSEIDGPTLINSKDFRINIEDCERVRHEAQHLTIMSLEIHVNTRNTLSPDPEHDPVAVIFYTIYNEMETFQQEIVGIIAFEKQPENNGLRNTRTSLTNYLTLVPGVKTCQVTCVEDEKLLFEKLTSVVKEWDPDLLIGYEIQMASWGYLIERARFLKINLISMLSRFCSEKKENKLDQVREENVVDQTADIDRISIPGRIVLNVWRLMRKEITLNVYTFENVYYHVLHKRTPKYSFHDLSQWYCGHQKETIVRYYVIRILGTIQILDKLDLIRRTSELARLFGIQFYEVLSRGSQFRVESMMLRTAAPMGFVAVSPSVQQRSHSRAPECVPLILEPLSKFYEDPLVVLDFQSLYPSVIIANNYCFSTCLGRIGHFDKNVPFEFGCTSLNVSAALLKNLVESDSINVSPQGIAFVKSNIRRGILPTMLEEILATRIMVKQSMKNIKHNNALKKLLDARQLGLKLIANVTYGYTGASYSGRMPCVEVADSIVGKARETLERAIRLIENTPEWRAKVVYGDTDSLFVLLPGRSKEEAFKIGQEMADAVTKTNPRPVKLKFEKVYLPCVLQTKKRYVGFMYETINQEKPIFDAKGIETVRRDSCPATAKILEKSLKILFETHDINSVKNYVLKQFRCVMNGRMNLMDFIFAKEYRGLSGYKPGACVPALEIAKRRINKDPRSEPRTGERVPYVVVYGLPGLPIIRLVHEPGDLLMNPSLRINATYYITRVISPPLERIFSLMGANVKTWYAAFAHTQKLNLPMSHYPRGTITQYFVTRNCPSCDCPITSTLCDNCCHDQAGTAADLQHKIRKWERAVNHLNQICVSCTKSNSSVDHCTYASQTTKLTSQVHAGSF